MGDHYRQLSVEERVKIMLHEFASHRPGTESPALDAQRPPCRLEAMPLAGATEWLEGYRRFWEGPFQRLDALLDELKTDEKKRGRTK